VQATYAVPEERGSEAGRTIRLRLLVLPALSAGPPPTPSSLHGGPGAPATAFFAQGVDGWLRRTRDVVLIDQRGTGGSNPMRVPQAGSDEDLQGYFGS